tara:strand:+ start:355 stop:1272 length:918 start_codon:yes stop_codon:yes gene_type:complete
MVDEVVPQEQMEVFNRPREMAEPMPEEMAMEEPQEERLDSGIRQDDPKVALGTLAQFLIDLQPEKINTLKSFVMRFPLVMEAVSKTTQTPPEELNDLFNAALGDPEANKRLVQKFGGEEDMTMQEQQMQPQQMQPQQMEEQPSFAKGGVQARGAGISEQLVKSAESSALAVLNETQNVKEALNNFEEMQDIALESGMAADEFYKLANIGDQRAKESFLNEGGSRFDIATKYLPFTEGWRSSARIRAIERGSITLAKIIDKEKDSIVDSVREFFGNEKKSGLFGTGEKPRGSITPERAQARELAKQ